MEKERAVRISYTEGRISSEKIENVPSVFLNGSGSQEQVRKRSVQLISHCFLICAPRIKGVLELLAVDPWIHLCKGYFKVNLFLQLKEKLLFQNNRGICLICAIFISHESYDIQLINTLYTRSGE